jgi:sec-independent protein translocase protein TatB
MFNQIGWSELILLAIVGLVVLGPERLPKAAADAAKMLRQLRTMARSATADLKAELGPEMADLDLASLHPRRMMQSMLLDDDAEAAGVATPVGRPGQVPLQPGEPPPYDADAT